MKLAPRFAIAPLACAVLAAAANAQQSIQPGFFSHEPAEVALRINGARSGELCGDLDGTANVCNAVSRITVTGRETCDGADGQQYPCTRYGYRFDYTGAEPGAAIQCHAKREDAFRRAQNMDYTLDLDAGEGDIFYPIWIAYGPVERRTMLTEVHDCTYEGARLATIEFILTYEPEASPAATAGPAAGIDEPLFTEIPNACSYLTEPLARNLLPAERVQASFANEHIPNFWSQCVYSGGGASVGFVFKFMVYEMWDVANLDPDRLDFNATFAGGGEPPVDTLDELGKIAFVFDVRDRTTLLVVTGIQGPPDGAARPSEFVASYYLQDPDRSHAVKIATLRAFAEEHLREWHAR